MAQKIFCIINDPKTMFFTPFYFYILRTFLKMDPPR